MDQDFIVPRVAFVINLAPAEGRQLSLTRLRHLVQLFHSHRVDATWAIGDASMAHLLREQGGNFNAEHAALNVRRIQADKKSGSRGFAQQLSQELARVTAVLGQSPSTVLGDSTKLRSCMVLLSQMGVETMIAESGEKQQSSRPRPLPCGMWHLSPNMHLPRTGLLERLTRRGPSVREMIAGAVDSTMLVSIAADQVERLSARGMQSLEQLVKEVSWAGSRGQIEPTTLTEIVANLRRCRQVKPQRSIMRVAA